MISILVTYYNQEKYVSRSLDSIFSQNLISDYEILIGDDGSQDNTVKIIKEYQLKNPNVIKLFIMPRDNNLKYNPVERASLNRLNLFSNAKGQYICFLDGDDAYYDNDFIQDSINEMESNKTIIGVAHNFIVTHDNGNIDLNENITRKNYITLSDYAKGMYLHVGSIIFRNSIKNNFQKLRKIKSFDDNDITYYFLNKGKLLYKNKNVYNYFTNSNSICNTTSDFEFRILNAIDYEIIQKIINKKHFLVFKRYFSSVWDIYINKSQLQNYTKFKSICLRHGLFDKLYRWDNLLIYQKIFIIITMKLKKIIYNNSILELPKRIIKKIKNCT